MEWWNEWDGRERNKEDDAIGRTAENISQDYDVRLPVSPSLPV